MFKKKGFINKSIEDYQALSAEIIEINRILDNQPALGELCKKYSGEEIYHDGFLFGCFYEDIYITIYEMYSLIWRRFDIVQTVETFSGSGQYIRDLSEGN